MSVIEIVAGSLLILCCVLIIVTVSLQSGKGSGLSGVIMGGESSTRGRGKDTDAKLAGITKIMAVVFFAMTLVVNIIALVTK